MWGLNPGDSRTLSKRSILCRGTNFQHLRQYSPITQAGFELIIPLPQFLGNWDYRPEPGLFFFFTDSCNPDWPQTSHTAKDGPELLRAGCAVMPGLLSIGDGLCEPQTSILPTETHTL